MKRISIILSLVLLSFFPSLGQEADSLWRDGVNAYTGGNYDVALRSFTALEKQNYVSAELFYNIGNCYFKQGGFLGKSILYYERALRLDPSFADAENNLALAGEYTVDKIDQVPEFVLVTWTKALRDAMDSDTWAWISIVFFALTALLLLLFRFAGSLAWRKTSFGLAIPAFLFSIAALCCSVSLNLRLKSDDEAIVMVPVSSVKGAPSTSDQSLFIIHEGTKVGIIEELGEWKRVELADGRQGWIMGRDVENI